MTNTTDAHARGGRGTWIILVLVALAAIVGLVLFLSNNRDGPDTPGNAAGPAPATLDVDAERASGEAAADTGRTLEGTGDALAEGAGEAARATGDAAQRAADATAAGARDAAQAAGNAVERSTDGDPDSDNNERR